MIPRVVIKSGRLDYRRIGPVIHEQLQDELPEVDGDYRCELTIDWDTEAK